MYVCIAFKGNKFFYFLAVWHSFFARNSNLWRESEKSQCMWLHTQTQTHTFTLINNIYVVSYYFIYSVYGATLRLWLLHLSLSTFSFIHITSFYVCTVICGCDCAPCMYLCFNFKITSKTHKVYERSVWAVLHLNLKKNAENKQMSIELKAFVARFSMKFSFWCRCSCCSFFLFSSSYCFALENARTPIFERKKKLKNQHTYSNAHSN